MTDVEPGRCDESPEHSDNREIEHRTGDSSNADDTRRGSHLPNLAENGGLSAQGDERLPEHDAIARVVEEGLDTGLRMISASISRSGPLPAVEEFKGYESVLPGAAERIMKMAELNAKAAAEMTEADATATRAAAESVAEDGRAVKRGQTWFGFLALLLIVIAGFLAFQGEGVPAIFVALFGALSGFGTIIRPVNGQRWRPKE